MNRRFRPRSAAKNNKLGCDNAGQPIVEKPVVEKTDQGEVFLEVTSIPTDIQALANQMFRETDEQANGEK
jgi:hypothetical protein